MNQINPDKLLLSKWTAVQPVQKQRHFIVTRLIRADDETIVACEVEAIINKKTRVIDWHELRDSTTWITGWQ